MRSRPPAVQRDRGGGEKAVGVEPDQVKGGGGAAKGWRLLPQSAAEELALKGPRLPCVAHTSQCGHGKGEWWRSVGSGRKGTLGHAASVLGPLSVHPALPGWLYQ